MRRTSFSSLPIRRANSVLVIPAAVNASNNASLAATSDMTGNVNETAPFGARFWQRLAAFQIAQ